MSSSLTGTLPPTSPVFPPCGTIPILFSLQYLTILLTSSVVRGLSTVVDFPLYFPIQSSLNAASSSAGVFDGERVDRMEDGGMKLEKCARSSSVIEFKFGDTVVEVHLLRSKLEDGLQACERARTRCRATTESMADVDPVARSDDLIGFFFSTLVFQLLTRCDSSWIPRRPVRYPTIPMDSTRAESSTPSRKRSRWENDEDKDVPMQLSPQRAPKPKRSRLSQSEPSSSPSSSATQPTQPPRPLPTPYTNKLHSVCVPPRTCHPPILPARSVFTYEKLNQIEEGSYGVVFRARDTQTGDVVALKKLKLEEEKHGFPITALREINALMACRHENVVNIREVVVGETLTQ